jgi:hypothetical protein
MHKQISEANFSLPPAPLQPPNRSRMARRKGRAKKGERKTMMKNFPFFLPEAVYDTKAYHAASRADESRDDPRTTEERRWTADSS